MPKFMFSESEEIWRKNADNRKYRTSQKDSILPKKLIVVNNKIKRLNTHCKDCREELRNKSSQYLGICPLCDNK